MVTMNPRKPTSAARSAATSGLATGARLPPLGGRLRETGEMLLAFVSCGPAEWFEAAMSRPIDRKCDDKIADDWIARWPKDSDPGVV